MLTTTLPLTTLLVCMFFFFSYWHGFTFEVAMWSSRRFLYNCNCM